MHKSCPVKIKAAGSEDGLADGQFRAVVSVFDNKDSYGDVVRRGAFVDTLAEWEAKGDPIPVYWSHRMDDPDMNIGYVLEAKETDVGLEVLAQLDVGEDASPKARQVYRMLKGRRVTQFSFAYDVDEGGFVESKDEGSYYELRKLRLHEVGPTPVGANDQTELLAVKSAQLARDFADSVKAGRVLSSKNETTLREALGSLEESAAQIKNVLAAVESSEETTDGKATTPGQQASGDGPANDEEPERAKSEEPSRCTSAKTWAALIELTDMEGATL